MKVGEITQAALFKAVNIAVFTMKDASHEKTSNTWHKLVVAARAILLKSLKEAAGGALINTIFIDHFQDVAHGHFIVRRLKENMGKKLWKPCI